MEIVGGNTIRFTAQFFHQGAAYSGAKAHVAIGRKLLSLVFDEVIAKDVNVQSIPAHAVDTQMIITVDLPIPSNIVDIWKSSGLGSEYGQAYIKIINIPGADLYAYGPVDDIHIVGGSGGGGSEEAVFSNLSVSYNKV
ncbi:MAG: hypothetical protein PHI12_14395 [Dehalococcoidales bacterium]|nr:hypothetical protein [Dehalococcoidales bacterium]